MNIYSLTSGLKLPCQTSRTLPCLMAFAPHPFILKLPFWPSRLPAQLIFLSISAHFIGTCSILSASAKLERKFFLRTPEDTVRPIMIFIARTTGLTETWFGPEHVAAKLNQLKPYVRLSTHTASHKIKHWALG